MPLPHELPARYVIPVGEPNFVPEMVEVFFVEDIGLYWRRVDQSICRPLPEGVIPDHWKRVKERQPRPEPDTGKR